MNDENKVPVPDEAQASPAHAEDDIATLEREARAKREAELLNAQDDEEKDPVQPAVNKLKKRKRGNRLSCHCRGRAYLPCMGR